MKIIQQNDYIVNKWAGGITRQLYITPNGSSLADRNFDLRISSAVIELTSSTFSDFTGYTRYIMPLAGNIELQVEGKAVKLEQDKPYRFSGSDHVTSTNSSGAIDFNVIVRKNIKVDVRAVQELHLPLNQRQAIVFALNNTTLNGITLLTHDTAIVDEQELALTGHAVVILL